MKVKCENCGNYVFDTEEVCSECGLVNKNYKKIIRNKPTTIEELKTWYENRNLPPYETTRFFIGIDYKGSRAFGIYKDSETGNFVVYKNKIFGERKIRYEGKDEEYAVSEIYIRLKAEIAHQKELNQKRKAIEPDGNNFLNSIGKAFKFVCILIPISLFIVFIFLFLKTPQTGYYNINGKNYYYSDKKWYIYDEELGWSRSFEPKYNGNLKDYYQGRGYSNNNSYTDIRNSDNYHIDFDHDYYDDDFDSESDWDSSDSWDSSSTDWDSDW